jgi:hypothetical protein
MPSKSPLNKSQAIARINQILSNVKNITPPKLWSISTLVGGKLYELFVLSHLLTELRTRGHRIRFSGSSVVFKTGGGPIKQGDNHIVLFDKHNTVIAYIYTDVEVMTLGYHIGYVSDLSRYHEIDIVVVRPWISGYPSHDDLLLGVECKATAKFSKAFVREALGRRRELSYLCPSQPCLLDAKTIVPAEPASEYWLAFIDPAGLQYKESPELFGVELVHVQP